MMPRNSRRQTARVLLVALLAPLLLILSGPGAQAATYSEVPGEATIHQDHWIPSFGFQCNLLAYYRLDVNQAIKYKATCNGSGLSQGPTITVEFNGITEAAVQCQLTDAFEVKWTDTNDDGIADAPSGAAGTAFPFSNLTPTCHVGQVCLISKSVMSYGIPDIGWDRQCESIDMHDLPGTEKTGSCAYGTVLKPTVSEKPYGIVTPSTRYAWWAKTTGRVTASSTPPPTNGVWHTYTVVEAIADPTIAPNDGALSVVATAPNGHKHNVQYGGGSITGAGTQSTVGAAAGTTVNTDWNTRLSDQYTAATPQMAKRTKVVGVGVYLTTGSAWTTPWWQSAGTLNMSNLGQQHYGLSDPGNCAFYWGEKVVDVASSTVDEPLGSFTLDELPSTGTTVDPDPVAPAEPDTGAQGCGFSWSSPSTWTSAGICELVGLFGRALALLSSIFGALGDLADAVADLPGAVMGLLGDLLEALFVPSEDTITSNADTIGRQAHEAWGGWDAAVAGAIPDVSVPDLLGSEAARATTLDAPQGALSVVPGSLPDPGGGATCDGPGFSMPDFMVQAGLPEVWHPVAACSGKMASVAEWTYRISFFGVVLFTLFKTLELIQAGVGLSTHVRIVSDHSWSGAYGGKG